MTDPGNRPGVVVTRRSGWLIPLAVFAVTAAFSALLLVYYLTPANLTAERPAPTDATDLVALSVGGIGFHIPTNYLPYASDRQGGAVERLEMIALLPSLQGYSLAAAQEFASTAADSQIVNLTLHQEQESLSEQERLDRIFLPLVEDRNGTAGPFGLTAYAFRQESGYRDEELLVGDAPSGLVLLRCTKPDAGAPAPSCLGNLPLGDDLSLGFRFKRAHLERWHDTHAGIRALIGAFMDRQ